jgi:ABC-type Fe3+/spermidine/putrescine transport system ATPase subunit
MLEVRDIWKSYEGKPLLCGVNVSVRAGETICLLGASGSGKSTLLRIIAGLELPERGQVLWDGRDLADLPVHRRGFGLMFQDYALFPHRSVAENVAFGLRMQGVQDRDRAERVREALEQVNMTGFIHRRVTDLSGGEQQRVALARALAPRPRLLMFDEPLGALDRALKEQVEEQLRRLLHATGIPAIYVTHDQEEAFAVADRLVLLNNGTVAQDGAPSAVYERPASPWVARFLGLSNLLEGTLEDGSPPVASTPAGRFRGAWAGSGAPHSGAPVTVLLRPNSAGRLPAAMPTDREVNLVRGVVEDSVFRGDGFRLNLRAHSGQELSFFVDAQSAAGEEVVLEIDEDGVQFFPEAP